MIDTAAENNVTNISELNFYIENEKQYTSELAREARNKAKIVANLTASELNQKVKGIEAEITAKDAKIRTFVIPTNEELMIARAVRDVPNRFKMKPKGTVLEI